MSTTILRLPRTDKPDEHLLVHVEQLQAASLDLKLIGTEHEHLYHHTIKEAKIKSLQSGRYTGDLEEWKVLLRHAFLHDRPPPHNADAIEGLETVAAITAESFTITIRKNIGGITQRLGSVELKQNDDKEEVSPFEWVDSAVAASDGLLRELYTLQTAVGSQAEQVAALTKQLDDLVKAKREHEDELVKKFTLLLNSKKVKIRDQQRLLSAAKVDPRAVSEINNARGGSGRVVKGSRGRKRKAGDVEDDDEDVEDDSSEELEEQRQKRTPEASDDDDDDLDAYEAIPAKSSNAKMEIDEPGDLPPRRELPFNKKVESTAKPPAPVPTIAPDDEDETDDEL